MKHILLFEDFDLDKFLENPEEHIHGEDDLIDIGSYVNSYRGPSQIIGEEGNFWRVKIIGSSSEKPVLVPKDSVEKMGMPEVKSIIAKASNLANTKRELTEHSESLEDFISSTISDEDGEWKYRGSVKTAIDFLEEIVIDLYSLHKRDNKMKFYPEFDKLATFMAILIDNLLETREGMEMEDKINSMISSIHDL
jgi:hypothetical protein